MGFLWLLCFKYLCLYNNAAKIFGAEGVLRRRLENLESEMVYTTRGKCSIYKTSRVGVFFLKKVFACRRLRRRFYLGLRIGIYCFMGLLLTDLYCC